MWDALPAMRVNSPDARMSRTGHVTDVVIPDSAGRRALGLASVSYMQDI